MDYTEMKRITKMSHGAPYLTDERHLNQNLILQANLFPWLTVYGAVQIVTDITFYLDHYLGDSNYQYLPLFNSALWPFKMYEPVMGYLGNYLLKLGWDEFEKIIMKQLNLWLYSSKYSWISKSWAA